MNIELSLPPDALKPNNAPYTTYQCMLKRRAGASYKEAAWASALVAIGRDPAPHWKRASIRLVWYLRKGREITDPDNATAVLKSAIDGIQYAGVIENDKHLKWLAPVVLHDTGPEKLMILINPLPPLEPAKCPTPNKRRSPSRSPKRK